MPEMHVHAFSPLEVWHGAATLGLPLADYLAQLRDAGLGTLPGTAAEILDDEVRAIICPDKLTTDAVARGDRDGARGRPAHDRHDHVRPCRPAACTGRAICCACARCSSETGGFTEFVPLPFVHMEAPICLQGPGALGPDAFARRC